MGHYNFYASSFLGHHDFLEFMSLNVLLSLDPSGKSVCVLSVPATPD